MPKLEKELLHSSHLSFYRSREPTTREKIRNAFADRGSICPRRVKPPGMAVATGRIPFLYTSDYLQQQRHKSFLSASRFFCSSSPSCLPLSVPLVLLTTARPATEVMLRMAVCLFIYLYLAGSDRCRHKVRLREENKVKEESERLFLTREELAGRDVIQGEEKERAKRIAGGSVTKVK